MSLRHTGASLPDRHTVHEPPTYSTQVSAVQNDFYETLFYVHNKRSKNIFTQSQNSVTKDYNYLLIVMNSVFDYSLSCLLVLHK